eukprot:gene6916-7643_t
MTSKSNTAPRNRSTNSSKGGRKRSDGKGGTGQSAKSSTGLGRSRCKVVVSLNPFQRSGDGQEVIIHYAEDEFFSAFGFAPSDLPLRFDRLCGPTTLRATAHNITMAIVSRSPMVTYVNLHHVDGHPVSCHISLVSLGAEVEPQTSSESCEHKAYGTSHSCSPTSNPFYNADLRWAVLTIRSSSAVGNAKHCGIGLLPTDQVLPEHLSTVGNVANSSNRQAKKSQSNIRSNI